MTIQLIGLAKQFFVIIVRRLHTQCSVLKYLKPPGQVIELQQLRCREVFLKRSHQPAPYIDARLSRQCLRGSADQHEWYELHMTMAGIAAFG